MNPPTVRSELIRGRRLIFFWRLSIVWIFAATSALAADKPVDIDDIPLKGPPIGTTKDRVSGGTRGTAVPAIYLIAPMKTGATIASQPTLYWYLPSDTDLDIEFIVAECAASDQGPKGRDRPNSGNAKEALVNKEISGKMQKAGLHAVSLVEENKVLKLDVHYCVTVRIRADRQDASKNPFVTGDLVRVERPTKLQQESDGRAYAANGLWYDAIAALAAEINPSTPPNAKPRRELRGLLKGEHVFRQWTQSDKEVPKEVIDNEVTEFQKFLGNEHPVPVHPINQSINQSMTSPCGLIAYRDRDHV